MLNPIISFFNQTSTRVIAAVVVGFTAFALSLFTGDYSDEAYFGGDTWEYQSMAVNMVKGKGFQRFGGLMPFEEYKFDTSWAELKPDFYAAKGSYNFYRTPGYPVFMAGVYFISGVSPRNLKITQLILLVVCGMSTAFLGYRLWGATGFAAGLLGGGFFIYSNENITEHVLTEPLIIAVLTLFCWVYLWFEERKGWFQAVLLGILMGICLLVKGSMIFIPIFVGLWELWRFFKTKDRMVMGRLAVITFMTVATLAPWSAFATAKSGNFVLLSTQGEAILLDNNNELTTNGEWHPQWADDPNSFYNNDGMNDKPAWQRVLNFYYHHPLNLFTFSWAKMRGGFFPLAFLWVLVAVHLVWFAEEQLSPKLDEIKKKILRWTGILLLLIVLSGVFYTHNFPHLYGLYDVMGILFIAVLWLGKSKIRFRIPAVFWIILLNFVVISLITSVDNFPFIRSRFVRVMEFAFNLTGAYYLLLFISSMYLKPNSENELNGV